MRRLATTLLAVALLACFASAASAVNKYPPGPGGTCPDSVTIYQAQQSNVLLNPCYPQVADTVLGIRGIITGFRYRSTGRIYMENSNGAPFNGLQVYTNSWHAETRGFALGDSVSVCGLEQVYQGETQIQGVDGVSLFVRKISGGNPLPPFKVGTTTDFKWTPAIGPGSAFATCDPYEGSLVRINGPLKVARVAAGGGVYAGTNWLLVDPAAPGDSVIIDGYTLPATNLLAPPLNYTVDWVQGILRRATNQSVDCWLISLRDAGDQSVQAPPNLSEAFPVADNKLRLIFDRKLDLTTAQNPLNYTLGSGLSGSTVDVATVVGAPQTDVELTITDVLPRGAYESIKAVNIGSAACPSCLSSQQSLSFVLGVLSPAEVQAPLADSLAGVPCLDKSAFAGPGTAYGGRMTVRGVFVQSYGSLYYIMGRDHILRNGISVYNPPYTMTPGREYLIACRVQEYYSETELTNVAYVQDLGFYGVFPASARGPGGGNVINGVYPTDFEGASYSELANASCDPTQGITNAEDAEGMLVKVSHVKVVPFNTDPTEPVAGGSFRVVGPYPTYTDTILVSSLGGRYTFDATPGEGLNIIGVLHIDTDVPRILPRGDADIVHTSLGVDSEPSLELALRVQPNPGVTQRVSFVVPRKDRVELGVYDLQGRRLALLARGEFAAGEYARTWDGRLADGTRAAAGVYFYRLKVGKEVRTLRAVTLN